MHKTGKEHIKTSHVGQLRILWNKLRLIKN